jgi:RNA polymerase sigma factor (sigma-70 family)
VDASTSISASSPTAPGEVSRWFNAEIRPLEPALRAYLRGRFPSLPDPDDVVQETYIRLIRAREADRIRSPKSFLFVTARNIAVDFFRYRSSNPTEDIANVEPFRVLEEEPSATAASHRERELQLLESAIRSLPERCREVVMLKKIQGLSYEEISTKLGISRNTISAHLTMGVMKCRDYLRIHGVTRGGRL